MVWYGMVWYGMVWYGMVWYGMVFTKRFFLGVIQLQTTCIPAYEVRIIGTALILC